MSREPDPRPEPRWSRALGRFRRRPSPRGLRITSFAAALVIGLGLVGMVFAMHMSSQPQFCGSCHIMKPYYQSWSTSKHNGIACVECHISPGITAELRKKYEALSMVVKYFTATYGTNPWAEVSDAACLRCHERRLLEGKEEFHGVVFDHRPHLTEVRRGLKLRCTSCHSQIVQGQHIAVTASTCALCHFKDQEPNQGTGRCLICHESPDRVTTAASGTVFDHSQVARLDMECGLCHGGVVRGEGNVPRERCLACHNQAERLEAFDESELLHRVHVSDHKVDCVNCHLQIEHGRLEHPKDMAAAEDATCRSCHSGGHTPQEDLYSGRGGRGVPSIPSPMFAAGVTCSGCHNQELTMLAASGEPSGPGIVRAGAVSCMSCHGPGYQKIFDSWKAGVDGRVAALRRQLSTSVPSMGLSPPDAWLDAKHNFDLVEQGRGIHNVHYAYALLDKAHALMNEARRERGLEELRRPWADVAAGSQKCLNCHTGVEQQAGEFAGRRFEHRPHLVDAQLDCETCHRPHAERPRGEVVRFGRDGCLPCHHRAKTIDVADCMTCHDDFLSGTVTSHRGEFSHTLHLETGLECGDCHSTSHGDPRPDRATCTQCHEDG